MADNKDQNPGLKPAPDSTSDSEAQVFDATELDQIFNEDDPQFLKKTSEIKITSSGIDLSVMDQAFQAADIAEVKIIDQMKLMFNYSKNPRGVTIFWSCVGVVICLLILTWCVQKNLFQHKLFLTSFADYGDQVRDYNPLTETEDFYDNPKFAKNLMTLSKMFINVRASENSGPNPMLALEINVEGISADAIVEVKDREAEFKDLLLRMTEERNYDELVTTAGKQNLCEQFRQLINAHLTRGQVRRVLLNSFIIKP